MKNQNNYFGKSKLNAKIHDSARLNLQKICKKFWKIETKHYICTRKNETFQALRHHGQAEYMTILNKEEKRTFQEIFGDTPIICLASFHEIGGVSFYCLKLEKKKKYAVACGTWTNGREDWILPSCDVNFTMYDTERKARAMFALSIQNYMLNDLSNG